MDKNKPKCSLKCSTCNRPLSVAPVYYRSGNVCGRCTKNSLNEYSISGNRQILFERIAKHLSFPCSYEIYGCTSILSWDLVEDHEKNCTFSGIFCPLSLDSFKEKCSWVDQPDKLHDHIREKHRYMLQNPPTFKISSKFKNDIAFCEVSGRLFIIILTFNEKLKNIVCYTSGTFSLDEDYQCFVTVSSNQSIKPLIIDETKIKQFSIDCLNNPDSGLVIDHEHHLKQFSVDEILLTFNIRKELDTGNELHGQFLDELECPVCLEYMKPPIYICYAGHNICEDCSKKVESCPLCRGRFMGGRNFALEALTSKLNYPCSNKQFGCTFIAPSEQIKDHQNNCQYYGQKCFVEGCNWKGLNTILSDHLMDNHSEKLLQFDEIGVHESNTDVGYYFLLFDHEIFVMKMSVDVNFFRFSVFYLKGRKPNYAYNLTILGCSNVGMMVGFSHACTPVPYIADITATPRSRFDVQLPFSFLTQFTMNFQRLQFKLCIREYEENLHGAGSSGHEIACCRG